jgi:hypothetical protein
MINVIRHVSFPSFCPEPVFAKRSQFSIRNLRRKQLRSFHRSSRQSRRRSAAGKKTHLFFELSLCLSRACLDKMIRFDVKVAQKTRFLACSVRLYESIGGSVGRRGPQCGGPVAGTRGLPAKPIAFSHMSFHT